MGFDRLAPHYRWMEFVLAGGKLQRARTAWLSTVRHARRVLLAGEGNGRFLAAALPALSGASFHCLDASAAMLRRAQATVPAPDRARVRFEQAELPHWDAPVGCFDLVVTNFFLDCFQADQLSRVMEGLAGACDPGAVWLLADFTIPGRPLAGARARLLHALMYGFFTRAAGLRATALVPPEPILDGLGFRCDGSREYDWGLIRSSRWRKGVDRGPA